jgi:hypothetical protein
MVGTFRPRLFKLALVGSLSLPWLASCSATSCNAFARWSFRIRVRDSVTGSPICDAALSATDGATETPLTSVGSPDCVYVGVAEQLGTFHISVTKAGYQTSATTVIVDQKDECNVITKDATVTLVPQ